MQLIKYSIIGLLISIGLVIQYQPVNAIYSPVISERVAKIKQNVMSARQQNGVGTLVSAIEKAKDQDRKLQAAGKATGLPIDARRSFGMIAGDIGKDFLDSIFMPFNILSTAGFKPITNCLRDDIWELENLKDAVYREMLKAYLTMDQYHGSRLEKDYYYLGNQIERLKKHGMESDSIVTEGKTSARYFFKMEMEVTPYMMRVPPEEIKPPIDTDKCINACEAKCVNVENCKKTCKGNDTCEDYCEFDRDTCEEWCDLDCDKPLRIEWAGCPEGDFLPAFNRVIESVRNLKTAFNPAAMVEWGSILEMAEANGRRKGEQWIKANQVTLTIGGREGGTPQSLMKGGGFDRFAGQMRTQGKVFKDMIGPLVPLYDAALNLGQTLTLRLFTEQNESELLAGKCAYYYPNEGVFRACTPDQILAFYDCNGTLEERQEMKDEGVECTRFRDPEKVYHYATKIRDYREEAEIHEAKVKRAATVFSYHAQLNTVTENNIHSMRDILKKINTQIKFGTEAYGQEGGSGLPTLLQKFQSFYKKHCGGK